MTSTVAVIGGGISGLAGAYALGRAGARVVLLEAGERLGGKILTTSFAGRPVDEGADAFLSRRPDALDLCRDLGLTDDLVAPATGQAALWLGGRLRPIPGGCVLGVPVDFWPLARSRILSPAGLARAVAEAWLPGSPVVQDTSVGRLVRRRYGRQVHERLVDPLLGSINAGRTEELSLDVGATPLAAAARRSGSLTRALRAERSPAGAGPPFHAPAEGMGVLVEALAKSLSDQGADVRLSTPVGAVERAGAGGGAYRVVTAGGDAITVDRVLVAVPAFVAASLLNGLSPAAGGGLAAVRYASVAVVTLAYPAGAVARPLAGSGFLVPRGQRRLLTACSFFSNKWPRGGDTGAIVLRASVGRMGDDRALGLDDAALVEGVAHELAEALGLAGPPAASRVSRWPRSFPQFPPGHLGAMDEVEAALGRDAPGVAVAGAYLRGVGVPACIAGAGGAAARLAPPTALDR